MNKILMNRIKKLKKRYKKIKKLLNNFNSIKNRKKIIKLSQEYSKLNKLNLNFKEWKKNEKDIKFAEKNLYDPEIHELAKDVLKDSIRLKIKIENKLNKILILQDKDDIRGCFLEIRAATGGKESALFTTDLFKMYTKYAEYNNWNIKIINSKANEYGGYKEIIAKISNKGSYGKLKFESGGHRVQRIPITESQGRIHTSSCTIAVIPSLKHKEIPKININEIRIDTFKSSGAGGQHVNTTDSAIRITHIPSGLVVECQNERSQHKNKSKALSVLSARLKSLEIQKRHNKESNNRKNLLGTGYRSDRIRTYNFPQGRITDHRIGLTLYNLNEIMNGKLDLLINPITDKYNRS